MRLAPFLTLLAVSAAAQDLPAPRPWLPPTVKLLSSGGEPKQVLAYKLKVGTTGVVTAVTDGEWQIADEAGTAPIVMPTITVPIQVTVSAPGELTYKVQKSTAVPQKGQKPEAFTVTIVDALEGVAGSIKLSAAGVPTSVNVYPGPKDARYLEDVHTIERRSHWAMEMLRTMFNHLFVPLPTEAVGPGASWQVERHTVRGSVTYLETVTYTLGALDKRLMLTARVGGRHDPASPLEASQIFIEVSGQSKAELDLSVPVASKVDEAVMVDAKLGSAVRKSAQHSGRTTLRSTWREGEKEKR